MISPAPDPPNKTDVSPTSDGTSEQDIRYSKKLSTKFRDSWRRFSASRSGRRFQDRYAYRKSLRRKRSRRLIRSSWLRKFEFARIFYIGGGLILMALSAVGGWLPVLGWGTAFLGLGMIAGEFKPAARLMDWMEKRGRKLLKPVWLFLLTLPRWLQIVLPVVIAVATFLVVARTFQAIFMSGS